MEESLKTLRLTHRTLVVLLVTALLFALSPNKHETYERAYAFLDQLQGINGTEYRSWAQNVSDKHMVSRHDFLFMLFDEVARQGGPVITWDSLDNATISQILTVGQDGPSTNSDSLDSLNREFREDIAVQQISLSVDRLASQILNELHSDSAYRLDDLKISGTAEIRRLDIQLYLYNEMGELQHVYGTANFDTRPINGQSFHVWLAENGQTQLISDPDENGVVFKPLRAVWPFIYAKSVEEAKDWIQQELLRMGDAQVLSVFGISISEFQAGIAAPGITFVLLYVLWAQLRHTRRLARFSDSEVLQTFPWMPIFSGSTGRHARILTLVALPILANFVLLLRARGAVAWTGWIEWLLVIVAGLWAYTEANRLAALRELGTRQLSLLFPDK